MLALLALLMLVGCGFLAPEAAPEAEEALVRTTQALEMRSGPAENCPVVGQQPAGAELPVKAITLEHDWWQVETGDGEQVGWIMAAFTTPVNDVSGVLEMPGPACGPASGKGESAGPTGNQPGEGESAGPTGNQPGGGDQPPAPPGGQGGGQQAAACGNGVVETGEACDGTDCGQGQFCNDACQCELSDVVEATCGNDVLEEGEACDGDDTHCPQGAFCNTSCQCLLQNPTFCGNGVVDAGEACDGTSCGAGQFCNAGCQCELIDVVAGVCGNGVVEGGEACDGTSCGFGQFCNASCQCELFDIQ